MKFAIITHVNHIVKSDEYLAYAPYVQEMNIWLKYTDEVIIVAPLGKGESTPIDIAYQHHKINFKTVPDFNIIGLKNILISFFKLPIIFWKIFWAMKKADHIHLRCPGNMGLIGCFVQILFPGKSKTAKYAGNWDPKSKQPWSYRLQKHILSNHILTRNMNVLVYGKWQNQSKNIKPFFTATYSNSEIENTSKASISSSLNFIFTGSLVKGKNPMYALMLIKEIVEKYKYVVLNLYGEGIERDNLESYIVSNNLQNNVFLHGNQSKEILKTAYKKSHFVILPSTSEGWPKAIAEGMFWGCVPLATKVSCLPFMLDDGNRGILLEMNEDKDLDQILNILSDREQFLDKSMLATNWSQKYTINVFEDEIKNLLNENCSNY